MDFKNVHHLREIQVTNVEGKTIEMMQYSSESISRFRPHFVDVPLHDQLVAHELYLHMGGRRREGMKIGNEVILEMDEIEAPRAAKAADA